MASPANLRFQGPAATVGEVRNLVSNATAKASEDAGNVAENETARNEKETIENVSQEPGKVKHSELPNEANRDNPQAEVAAEVADSAEKLDQEA